MGYTEIPEVFICFIVMLGMEGSDFSNMDLIIHLNSMPRVCESLETTDSTAHSMSTLECRFVTEKFKPLIRDCFLRACENLFRKVKKKFIYETCMYIMAPEAKSTTYFINPSHQSVCVYVYSPYRW
jgi:hypothetical protein